jgi:phenylalanyl-tRNA synthetase beta chain
MGFEVTASEINECLGRLFVEQKEMTDDAVTVVPPTFRMDLEREIDLIEEVGRLVGFNKIPETLPKIRMGYDERSPIRSLSDRITDIMLTAGFNEVITYSFMAGDSLDKLTLSPRDPRRKAIPLRNPMNEEMALMRTTLVPGLIKAAVTNVNLLTYDLRLFEISRIYLPKGEGLPNEEEWLSALISGRRFPRQWGAPDAEVDFFDVKGIWEAIVDKLGLLEIEYGDIDESPYLDTDESCVVTAGKKPIGRIGKIAREVMKRFDLGRDCYLMEVNLTGLVGAATRPNAFTPVPRYPSVMRDISMVMGTEVKSGEIVGAIEGAGDSLIRGVTIFDIYRGKQIEAGKKGMALTVRYQSDDRTLTDEEVNTLHEKVIDVLKRRFGVQVR